MKTTLPVTILCLLVSLGALSACTTPDKRFDKEFYENKPLPKVNNINTNRQARNKIFEYDADLKACYAKVDALNPHKKPQ